MVSPECFEPIRFLRILDAHELTHDIRGVQSFQNPRARGEILGVMNTVGNILVCAPTSTGLSLVHSSSRAAVEPICSSEGATHEAPDVGATSTDHLGGASSISVNPACLATGEVPDEDGANIHDSADSLRNALEGVPRTGTGAGAAESLDVHRLDSHSGDDHPRGNQQQELGSVKVAPNIGHVYFEVFEWVLNDMGKINQRRL